MRYIDLNKIDTNSPEFRRWKATADQCYTELQSKTTHQERSDYLKKHPIWTNLKSMLVEIYGEKCWYSECEITGEDGEVDHFRPKNRSKAENNNVLLSDGYWWLAYDYLNYRLSCLKCNRPRNPGGKSDFFPLKEGSLPATIGKKDDDNMLLDPCSEEDVNLIDCDDTGKIIGLSSDDHVQKRVEDSNFFYNWDKFVIGRRIIRSECKTALEIYEQSYQEFSNSGNCPFLHLALNLLIQYTNPKKPYSSFAKRYIRLKIEGKPYEVILTRELKLDEL